MSLRTKKAARYDRCHSEGEEEGQETRPEWIEKTLKEWVNPTFPATEQIPLSFDFCRTTDELAQLALDHPNDHLRRQHAVTEEHRISKYFGTIDSDLSGSRVEISKEALRNSEFLEQLDNKFLLCLVEIVPALLNSSGTSSKVLVVLDQHAADERIRVEKFLTELGNEIEQDGKARTWEFGEDPENQATGKKVTHPVLVQRKEVEECRKWKHEFEKWGVGIEFLDEENPKRTYSQDDYAQIYISSVPSLLSDRFRSLSSLYPNREAARSKQLSLLQEFFRRLLEEFTSKSAKAIGVPEILKDMINSKACRGAIMFNDELSRDQCEKLISRLSGTELPFQCAHGRPSLVPLLKLPFSSSPKTLNWNSQNGKRIAWREWGGRVGALGSKHH